MAVMTGGTKQQQPLAGAPVCSTLLREDSSLLGRVLGGPGPVAPPACPPGEESPIRAPCPPRFVAGAEHSAPKGRRIHPWHACLFALRSPGVRAPLGHSLHPRRFALPSPPRLSL